MWRGVFGSCELLNGAAKGDTIPNMIDAAVVWERLDVPGHDVCRLMRKGAAWVLDGAAVFNQDGAPVRLDYQISGELTWHARRARITGSIGLQLVEITVERTPDDVWSLNGLAIPTLSGDLDLDLGFTPATNLVQLRRLGLQIGETGASPAAWLDVFSGKLDRLDQTYERRSDMTYWYDAPRFEYQALLKVDSTGFILDYPNLWRAGSWQTGEFARRSLSPGRR